MKRCFALALLLFSACQFVDRRVVPNPGSNEIIRVEGGERLYFDLEEDSARGQTWECRSDDADVDVYAERSKPGFVRIRARVHCGFDGPATLRFSSLRRGAVAEGPESFTVSLFRRTDTAAFWK